MPKWSYSKLSQCAQKMAVVSKECPTEQRGDLLLLVSKELSVYTQHYTASLFRLIANAYNNVKDKH